LYDVSLETADGSWRKPPAEGSPFPASRRILLLELWYEHTLHLDPLAAFTKQVPIW
jgi:hypothetical protein